MRTVVLRLHWRICADVAVFGKKDWEQAISRRMERDLNAPARIVDRSTARGEAGLAMPSRDVYLTSNESDVTPRIHAALLARDADTHMADSPSSQLAWPSSLEKSTRGYADLPKVVRESIKNIGYNGSGMGFDRQTCAAISSIDHQSPVIAQKDKSLDAAFRQRRPSRRERCPPSG